MSHYTVVKQINVSKHKGNTSDAWQVHSKSKPFYTLLMQNHTNYCHWHTQESEHIIHTHTILVQEASLSCTGIV